MVTKLVVLFVLVTESLKGGIFFTFVSSFPTCNVSQGFLYQKNVLLTWSSLPSLLGPFQLNWHFVTTVPLRLQYVNKPLLWLDSLHMKWITIPCQVTEYKEFMLIYKQVQSTFSWLWFHYHAKFWITNCCRRICINYLDALVALHCKHWVCVYITPRKMLFFVTWPFKFLTLGFSYWHI